MVRLGDEAQVVAHFSAFRDDVILMQDRCTVCTERTIGQKSYWMHPMVHFGDEAQVVACFSPFRDDVILMQHMCTVCTEHTIGSEIIMDAPNGTLR